MSTESSPPRPPSPPDMPRALRLYPQQIVSVSVFAIVALLALFGAFGQRNARSSARGVALAMRVEHPARMRYGQRGGLYVWIENASARRLDTVRVAFDTAYINGFSSVTFTPSVERAWAVVLAAVEPHEVRLVHAEFEADRVGLRHGTVSASAVGTDSVRLAVRTLVFP